MSDDNAADQAAADAGLLRDENESDEALLDRVRVATWEPSEADDHGPPLELAQLNQPIPGDTSLRLRDGQ